MLIQKLPIYTWIYLLSIVPIANAQIYKWVDTEGNIHYTQEKPPAGIKGEVVKAPPKTDSTEALAALENQQKKFDELREARITAKEEAKKKKEEEDAKKARCEQSKARLASYLRPRVNIKDEDGNVIRATEERRQEEIAKSNDYIKEHCDK